MNYLCQPTLQFLGHLFFILTRFNDRLLFIIGNYHFDFTKNDKNMIRIQLTFSFFRHYFRSLSRSKRNEKSRNVDFFVI